MLRTIFGMLAGWFLALLFAVSGTSAAPVNLTTADLNSVVSLVRVITLGGPSQGYIGALILTKTGTSNGNSIGTGRGVAVISGTVKNINGTWVIRANQFCRKWAAFDNGKEVCETWRYLTQRSVSVRANGTEIGVNSW